MKSKVALLSVALMVTAIGAFARAQDRRQITDEGLWSPLFVTVGPTTGSGFFLRADRNITFVTAAHLIYNQAGALNAASATVEAPSPVQSETARTVYRLDLAALQTSGDVRADRASDVLVARVGVISGAIDDKGQGTLTPVQGVTVTGRANGGIVIVSPDTVDRLDHVAIGNQIVLFGYPGPLGIPNAPQIDFSQPLLRRGIIAGADSAAKTIILDAFVSPGNSGGPVFQMSAVGKYRLVGLVTQLVPALQEIGFGQRLISNSGYAVAISMDAVLDLVAEIPQPK